MNTSPMILWAPNIPRPSLSTATFTLLLFCLPVVVSILELNDLDTFSWRLGPLVLFTRRDSLRYSQREYQPPAFVQDVEIVGEGY